MELRHIRYFLAVAEEGNFTRAAAHLGIGQPPLSQQIRDLEQEIGVQLFHRVPHGAVLTEPGRIFREKVVALPQAVADAMEAARRAARGESGELRMGFTGAAAINPIVQRIIRDFRKERPGIALQLLEANSIRLRTETVEGRLDLAILRPNRTDPPELVCHELTREALVAAVSLGRDPLPEAADIPLSVLSEHPLILTPQKIGISLRSSAIEACRAAGFEPVIGQPAPQIISILSLVAAGLGFSLVPESMSKLALDGVVYKRLIDGPTVGIAVGVRRGPLPAAAAAFLAKAKSIAAASGQ
ncbi:LysR family transcriptional regulator [Breoghania sp.]|uniref:LysR family transcriptional regulator n=1 Tax=Breoghania sp. TaxID=2065378 RepID=UPI002AA760AC|nr:LysR family transcriptional regulator [Breoghania sp.]